MVRLAMILNDSNSDHDGEHTINIVCSATKYEYIEFVHFRLTATQFLSRELDPNFLSSVHDR